MQVVSPPRRGPAPTGYTGRVGWLPRPVAQIMRGWVHQRGYPIINVYRNLETGVVTINQRRFLAVAGAGGSVACNATTSAWWIPSPSSAGGAAPAADTVFWVPPTCANITLPVKVARDDWLVLNSGLIGLYRVRYDARTLTQLSKLPRAAWLQMAPVTRLQLVSDSLDLARLGRAPYQTVLRMLSLLGRDPNPMVWRAALPHLIMLQRQLRTRRDGVALRSWLQDLVSPHAPSIGFTTRPQDTPNQASLRVKVTTLACLADHAVCQRKAKKALKQFMAGNTDAM
ncbi:hypothetical protein ONE63_007416 [Megalurothrips usitatus]|uniref:ERAP1-like C-terminal domain-containing protein n=1 Tax=Megalurothrips usitatus TaxID=439358 RepID=A0AAV7XNQ6_9NEOP|nr:hypothetical protein ONE63_007416 [Megalurothrips usitatus]